MNEVQTAHGLINHFINLYRQGKFTKEQMKVELDFQKRNYPTMYEESLRIINNMKNKNGTN
jgi:hypothetical protein